MNNNPKLGIVVIGASGDLARKKIFPALFALFCQGLLPEEVCFWGFARSRMDQGEFKKRILENLTCRYSPDHSCQDYIDKFLARCHYFAGTYDSGDSFLDLYSTMKTGCDIDNSNLLFYLAIPPVIFTDVTKAMGDAGLVRCDGEKNWTRAVIEKPFGKDRESSDKLIQDLSRVFTEPQIYRIDHYLGKEVVQNLLVTRFANEIFDPIWNARYIDRVDIIWEEDIGTGGRGGYFDSYGIIRDVIQNHLLQVLSMVAMEEPLSLSAKDIRDNKVKLLKSIPPVKLEDIVLGQYTASQKGQAEYPGYLDDPTVPENSLCPTFAKVKLKIQNRRWEGVPFTIRAGKALDRKRTEIHIRFRSTSVNIFCNTGACPPSNELIIRIQPDEGMHLKIINKVPGVKMNFNLQELDLNYKSAYADNIIPEAYESLLLDVINGEKGLFIRDDELEAAWDIFTPVLHQIDNEKIKPFPYPFGSRGPKEA
jgi:glucose-6-phosphate 1-dehydrogenase